MITVQDLDLGFITVPYKTKFRILDVLLLD